MIIKSIDFLGYLSPIKGAMSEFEFYSLSNVHGDILLFKVQFYDGWHLDVSNAAKNKPELFAYSENGLVRSAHLGMIDVHPNEVEYYQLYDAKHAAFIRVFLESAIANIG